MMCAPTNMPSGVACVRGHLVGESEATGALLLFAGTAAASAKGFFNFFFFLFFFRELDVRMAVYDPVLAPASYIGSAVCQLPSP